MKWLFLVHQVQTPNSRERVKVWRLTKKVGAALYRNSVYVLPYRKERLEDFQWLCQQIRDSQGEASVFISEADSREEDHQLRGLFAQLRDKEFAAVESQAMQLMERVNRPQEQLPFTEIQKKKLRKEYDQLQSEFNEIQRIDFFPGDASKSAHAVMQKISKLLDSLEPETPAVTSLKHYNTKSYQGKVWATREHIHIDRLCSAWLIKRFIDPKARFIFVDESAIPDNAVPFDIFGKEFSHHGDDCTFETLLHVFQLRDPSLASIAEIVHDIDIKDGKFRRPEAAGVDAIVRALSDSMKDDHKTIELGTIVLNALYDQFSSKKTNHSASARKNQSHRKSKIV
jgi:hypothetical protein